MVTLTHASIKNRVNNPANQIIMFVLKICFVTFCILYITCPWVILIK